MKSAKKTKKTKKGSKPQYKQGQIFFIGIASLVILVGSITIAQQTDTVGSPSPKGKVLSENVSNLFPSKKVGATVAVTQPSTAPVNTNTNTALPTPSPVNLFLPTPTFVCVGSIGGVCPTLTPVQAATQPNAVTTTTNTATNTNCSSNALMQLLSELVSFLNALFGIGIPLPTIQCTVTNTNATAPATNTSTNTTTTTNTNTVAATPIPVVSTAVQVVPSTAPFTTAVSQAPVAITQAPVSNVTVFPQQDQLSNWAGYIYNVPAGATGATLRSTWNVSQITCNKDGDYSPWIGFGGSTKNDPNIAQLGVDFSCTNGQAFYSPWTEAFPADPVYYDNDPVSIGDEISENITFQGNGKFMTTMMDAAKGWSVSLPMSFGGGYIPQTGEVVSELVTLLDNNGNVLPNTVPPYTPPTTFTNNFYSNNGQAEQPLVTASGFVRTDITEPNNNVALTQTSALTTNGFTVSFK